MKKIAAAVLCLCISAAAVFTAYADYADLAEDDGARTAETPLSAEESEDSETAGDDIKINAESDTPEPTDSPAPEPAADTPAPEPERTVFAVESEYASVNGVIKNIWERPFVYAETTYLPLRLVVENIGGSVEFNPESRDAYVYYDTNSCLINLDDPSVKVYNDVLFVPVRALCDSLGVSVGWYDGIVTIDKGAPPLSAEETAKYKEALGYAGYKDAFFTPRYVVNPYITYTYDYMNSDINTLARIYPDLFSVYSIGKSSEGRDITAFEMGKGDKKIILCGSMHAREHIASNFLMYLADSYAYAYANGYTRDGYSFRQALDDVTFIIVPMVNPDGINLVQNGFDSAKNPDYVKELPQNIYGSKGWKATVNGVDLNNNFDFLWRPKGSGPAYAGYGGAYAACEPETQAMQNLINDVDFKAFVSFHSQGQVVYWMDPNCDQSLAEKFEPFVNRICDETGFEKMPSDGDLGVSGYMTDYVRYYKRAMALTIELCPYIGDYPYPEEDFDAVAYPMRNIGLILADMAQYL